MDIIISNNQDYQQEIRENIIKFNKEKNQIGYFAEKRPKGYKEPFGFYAIQDNKLIGGIIVYKKMQWIEMDIFCIEKEYRNQNIGTQLINTVINYCKENDLVGIHVYTLDFQAKGFYEKQGFKLIAEIKNWPRNHTRYEFIKYVDDIEE